MKIDFEQTENKYTDIKIEGFKDQILLRGVYPAQAFQKLFDFLACVDRKDKVNLTITIYRGTVGNYVNINNG